MGKPVSVFQRKNRYIENVGYINISKLLFLKPN
jgi:hypothetical protein